MPFGIFHYFHTFRTRKIFKALNILQKKFNRHVFIGEGQIFSVKVETIKGDNSDTDVVHMDFEPCFKRHLILYQDEMGLHNKGPEDVLCFEKWRKGEVVFMETLSHDNNDYDYSYLWHQCVKWERREKRCLKDDAAA